MSPGAVKGHCPSSGQSTVSREHRWIEGRPTARVRVALPLAVVVARQNRIAAVARAHLHLARAPTLPLAERRAPNLLYPSLPIRAATALTAIGLAPHALHRAGARLFSSIAAAARDRLRRARVGLRPVAVFGAGQHFYPSVPRRQHAPQLYCVSPHTPSPQYRSMVPLNPAGQGFCAVVSEGVSGQSLSGRHCLRTRHEPTAKK